MYLNLPSFAWSHHLYSCCPLQFFSTLFDLIHSLPHQLQHGVAATHLSHLLVWKITQVYNPVCCKPFRESKAWLMSCTTNTVHCLLCGCCFCLEWLPVTKYNCYSPSLAHNKDSMNPGKCENKRCVTLEDSYIYVPSTTAGVTKNLQSSVDIDMVLTFVLNFAKRGKDNFCFSAFSIYLCNLLSKY